jgi:hypothetical protein
MAGTVTESRFTRAASLNTALATSPRLELAELCQGYAGAVGPVGSGEGSSGGLVSGPFGCWPLMVHLRVLSSDYHHTLCADSGEAASAPSTESRTCSDAQSTAWQPSTAATCCMYTPLQHWYTVLMAYLDERNGMSHRHLSAEGTW